MCSAAAHPQENSLAQVKNTSSNCLPLHDRAHCWLCARRSNDCCLSQVLCEPGRPRAHLLSHPRLHFAWCRRSTPTLGWKWAWWGAKAWWARNWCWAFPTCPAARAGAGPGQRAARQVQGLCRELASSPGTEEVPAPLIFVRLMQLASSAACLRFHLIGPRLARWLLMSQDRAHDTHFHVTHEFLAYMLGVRRVGVTVAADRPAAPGPHQLPTRRAHGAQPQRP
jgi:hypothetical protein